MGAPGGFLNKNLVETLEKPQKGSFPLELSICASGHKPELGTSTVHGLPCSCGYSLSKSIPVPMGNPVLKIPVTHGYFAQVPVDVKGTCEVAGTYVLPASKFIRTVDIIHILYRG